VSRLAASRFAAGKPTSVGRSEQSNSGLPAAAGLPADIVGSLAGGLLANEVGLLHLRV
jgi:hypothetical protein